MEILQNLGMELKKSSGKWKIVIGHHTIRSVGHHGDTQELVQQLLPILQVPTPIHACKYSMLFRENYTLQLYVLLMYHFGTHTIKFLNLAGPSLLNIRQFRQVGNCSPILFGFSSRVFFKYQNFSILTISLVLCSLHHLRISQQLPTRSEGQKIKRLRNKL